MEVRIDHTGETSFHATSAHILFLLFVRSEETEETVRRVKGLGKRKTGDRREESG